MAWCDAFSANGRTILFMPPRGVLTGVIALRTTGTRVTRLSAMSSHFQICSVLRIYREARKLRCARSCASPRSDRTIYTCTMDIEDSVACYNKKNLYFKSID